MEAAATTPFAPTVAPPVVPPVVAVTVVHEPGRWFDEVLDGIAAQDYPNLRRLFLVVGEVGDVPARVKERIPDAFVRRVEGNPGFGAAANEVLRLVEGSSGIFCFLHDDVALEPSAIGNLVEEMYRSNAGIVGPKLVDWRRPSVLQHVGLAVDRFGEVDPVVEPGEIDQEQHDAVRDVFAVPSACLMVRADLFRTIGGFDTAIEYQGDDVDLCWRAHLSGARVLVVPSAKARHREGLAGRVGDGRLAARATRDRLHTVLSLTGTRRLAWVVPQLVLITLLESFVALVTGRARRAVAAIVSLFGVLPRVPLIAARRRQVAPLRVVPEAEVAGLQLRGSARLAAFLRGRLHTASDPEAADERRWREAAGTAPFIAWVAVIVLFLVGSRRLITDGVPTFGEFVPMPQSARDAWSMFVSGWSGTGLGGTRANPTGLALAAVASIGTLFHPGLLFTASVVGLFLIGVAGAYRLGGAFPSARARLSVLLVYGAVPLPSQLLSSGRWSALVVYAALPWGVHLLRRLSGIDPFVAAEGDVDGDVRLSRRRRFRQLAQLALLTSMAVAFAPVYGVVFLLASVVLGVVTFAVGSRVRVGATWLFGGVVATAVAFVANLPWSWSFIGAGGWTALVGVAPNGAPSIGLSGLLRFEVGVGVLTSVAVVLFLPVVAAPLVARSWRFAWAVRAVALVVVFGVLAVLGDRGSFPLALPHAGVLLVPVALGAAVAAGCVAAAFESDVLQGSFGWRQPLGVLSAVAVVVGVVPGVVAAGDGAWNMPTRTLSSVLGEFATDPVEGDYRILWVGDPSVMPAGAWQYEPGIAYAITDDGPITIADRWVGGPSEAERSVGDALRRMGEGVTLRGGRLLAPFGIRYVVVPLADGFNGTIDQPVEPPAGLVTVLDDQLDLSSPLTSPPNYLVFENRAYAPTRAVLTPTGAEASALAGDEAGTRADLRGAVPFGTGMPDRGPYTGEIPAGALHLAIPYDERWSLEVGGVEIEPRRSFGTNIAFDVPAGGVATLGYDSSVVRLLWVLALMVGWLALALGASRWEASRWIALLRPRPGEVEPLLDEAEQDALAAAFSAAAPGAAALAGAGMSDAADAADTADGVSAAVRPMATAVDASVGDEPSAEVPVVDDGEGGDDLDDDDFDGPVERGPIDIDEIDIDQLAFGTEIDEEDER